MIDNIIVEFENVETTKSKQTDLYVPKQVAVRKLIVWGIKG